MGRRPRWSGPVERAGGGWVELESRKYNRRAEVERSIPGAEAARGERGEGRWKQPRWRRPVEGRWKWICGDTAGGRRLRDQIAEAA